MNNTNTSNITNNSATTTVNGINNHIDKSEYKNLNKEDNEKSFDKIVSETFQDTIKNNKSENATIIEINNVNNLLNNFKNNKSEKDSGQLNKFKFTKIEDKNDNNLDIISQVENELLTQTNLAINNFESVAQINNNIQNEINEFRNKKELSNVFLRGLFTDTEGKINQINMTKDDVEFFANIVDANLKNQNNNLEINENNLKSAKVSNALLEMLNNSMETGRPVRVDFDNNISVVMQVTKDGKLNARFYPGDKAAEEYLRQNIQILKNQLEASDVEYENISYKERNQQQNNSERNKRQNHNQKEDN